MSEIESKKKNLELKQLETQLWVFRLAAGSLGMVMLSVVIVLLMGVFLPNEQIDNKDILAILNPAFNTIIGAFVGSLATLMGFKTTGEVDIDLKKEKEVTEE